jgi:predicted small secreted protein
MKRGYKVFLIFGLVALLLASCTTFQLSGAQITKEIPSYDRVGDFDITLHCHEFFGSAGGANLLNISSDAMDTVIYDAIQREIQKFTGDAAVNVEIEYQASFIDLLANSITFGLYAPATAHISGVIVKYN